MEHRKADVRQVASYGVPDDDAARSCPAACQYYGGGDGSWRGHYRHVAIRLTQIQIKDGSNAIEAALDQFRYGVTPRALAWALAAVASPLLPRRRSTPRRTSEIA